MFEIKMGSTKKSERKRHKHKDEDEAEGRKRREDDDDEEKESKRRQEKEHKSKKKERKEKKHSKRFSPHTTAANRMSVCRSCVFVAVHALYVTLPSLYFKRYCFHMWCTSWLAA